MIGSVISHYKILDKLGEGGMGVVYKAHDTTLDRTVALKFLPQALTADRSERERFYQEARAASQLLHPNVTAIFEIGESEGQMFLAMEYVDGRTLSKLILDEEPLAVKKAIDLAIQMCTGLSIAHEKGIVHRDIKSENLLVNGKGELKITDFGLAKLKGSSKLTKAGSTLGTAAYMSPEQAQGEDVDARSDIFSAGVVLYELLAGKLPFRGDHQAAMLYSLINEDPLPLERFNEKITPELQRIVSKALAKDREDRYQHADEMLADLKRERKGMEYARTGAVALQPSSRGTESILPVDPAKPSAGRKRMTPIIAGAALLLLAAGIYVFREKMPGNAAANNPSLNKIAVLPFESLGPAEREYFADGLTDEIRTKLSGLSGLAVIARASSVQYKKTAKQVPDIGRELSVGYLLQGTIRWEEGDSVRHSAARLLVNPSLVKVADGTQVWSQSFEGTLSNVFEIQSDIARQVASALEVVLNPVDRKAIQSIPTDNAEAYDYFLRGQQAVSTMTPANLQAAVALFGKAVSLDPRFTDAYAQMVRMYAFRTFQGQSSDSFIVLAKKSLDRVLELEPTSFHAYWAQGYYNYYGSRNYEQALKYFTLALQLQPNNADIISAIGYVKRRQGKFKESLDLLTRGSELDPKAWRNWFELGYLELIMRRYNSADEHFTRAVVVFGRKSTQIASVHSLAVFSKKGDVAAAYKVFTDESDDTNSWQYKERSFQFDLALHDFPAAREHLARTVLAQPDINPVAYYMDMAVLLEKTSRHDQSRRCLDSARVLAENAVKIYPGEWTVHAALGSILAHLGQKARAIEEGRKCVDLMPLEKDAMDGGPNALYSIAQIYAVTGETDAAIDRLAQVLTIPSIYTTYFVQHDPEFASLGSSPRFQKLMEKYKVE
jgi:TolB-like protein/Flp pilus assembly protein TadD/predicted Ser/Thr protein kinase